MDYFPLNWGKPRASTSEHNWLVTPGIRHARPQSESVMDPHTRTQQPSVTGTSVVAVKCKDGIIMATDCLASYGSLARFPDVPRMFQVGDNCVIGASGDISDFQYIQDMLTRTLFHEKECDDNNGLGPALIHKYLYRVMYHRRCKMNFLWNTVVVGGLQDGKSFLGCVDMRGVTYSASTIATGYGAYIAQPILREKIEGREDTITAQEARQIVEETMRILFYRDARSSEKIQITHVDSTGVHISEPFTLETEWGFAENIRGYGRLVADTERLTI